MVIRAEGPRILLDPALRETLDEGAGGGAVEPRAAGAWLAHGLAAEAGGTIQLSDPSERGPDDRRTLASALGGIGITQR